MNERSFAHPIKGRRGYNLREVAPGTRRWVKAEHQTGGASSPGRAAALEVTRSVADAPHREQLAWIGTAARTARGEQQHEELRQIASLTLADFARADAYRMAMRRHAGEPVESAAYERAVREMASLDELKSHVGRRALEGDLRALRALSLGVQRREIRPPTLVSAEYGPDGILRLRNGLLSGGVAPVVAPVTAGVSLPLLYAAPPELNRKAGWLVDDALEEEVSDDREED